MNIRLLSTITSLILSTDIAMSQKLSVADVVGWTGEKRELVIKAEDFGSDITALQFNLRLPEGLTMDEAGILRASNHTCVVRTLDNGDHLFLLYSLIKTKISSDDTVLRIPINMPTTYSGNDDYNIYTGSIYNFTTATTSNISTSRTGSTVTVKVNKDDSSGITPAAATGQQKEETYYNLQGKQLANPQKGVNIVGGRKVVIK